MPTRRYVSTDPADLVDLTPVVTDLELAFNARTETHEWWEAIPTSGQRIAASSYWEGRKQGFRLAAVGATLPNSVSSGGPDDAPIVRARSSGAGYETLITQSGISAAPVGDLCLWMVSKAATSSAGIMFGLVGNNGGSLGIRQRNSDLIQAVEGSDGLVFNTRISQTLESDDWHLVQLNYDHTAGEISIWANGALLSGLTPSGGIYSPYTHAFNTQRLSMFAAYDMADGTAADGSQARSGSIAMCGVATTHAPDNSAWQAALEAMVAEKYPSLGL